MATLNEMDREYASLAASEGIDTFIRVPTLGERQLYPAPLYPAPLYRLWVSASCPD